MAKLFGKTQSDAHVERLRRELIEDGPRSFVEKREAEFEPTAELVNDLGASARFVPVGCDQCGGTDCPDGRCSSSIRTGMLVLVESRDGGSCHVGEVASHPDPDSGMTFIRLVPGKPWSARWIATKRCYRVSMEVFNRHLADWS